MVAADIATTPEQFDDARQQSEAVGLGMWSFLVTEVLLFGVLFTGYTVYRINAPHAFHHASQHLYLWIGAINTAILLVSSYTMVLAVHRARHGDLLRTKRLLAITAGLGLLFLCLKAVEWSLDYRDGIVPGINFDPSVAEGADPRWVEMFFVLYFFMTGLHGLHVLAGVLVISTLALIITRTGRVNRFASAVDMTGLYWHLVDIIWLFLFPLMYLVH